MSLLDTLEAVGALLARFVAYPSDSARLAHVLWIAHTHCMDAWESTPRLAFLSPEPASGKTRALEITELLVPSPVHAVNATPAYIFRRVGAEEGLPTILFDEIDTIFGPRARENEELRGVLNAGHRRGAMAGRCSVRGKTVVTEELPAYAAVAMAGLGNLPDTILSRSVIVAMRRRAPHERVESFRRRVHCKEGEALRERLSEWASKPVLARLERAFPDMPEGVDDRDADVWEPLLAIADEAGGSWPERARNAASELVRKGKDRSPSLALRLLADIRVVFDKECDDQLRTTRLLERLIAIEEAPWEDLKGKALDSRGLAWMLKPYEVSPTTIRTGTGTAKGYRRADFVDAWERYLTPSSPESVTTVTSGTPAEPMQERVRAAVTHVTPVTLAGERG